MQNRDLLMPRLHRALAVVFESRGQLQVELDVVEQLAGGATLPEAKGQEKPILQHGFLAPPSLGRFALSRQATGTGTTAPPDAKAPCRLSNDCLD